MEKQLNWGVELSLEQMAQRRVVANVWSAVDILAEIEKWQFKPLSRNSLNIWRETVENKVKDKVTKLVLPETLEKQMMDLVRPMGSGILKWKIFHEKLLIYGYFDRHILEQLCWTCAGTIDYRNTAERLILLQKFDISDNYFLACSYCLVDYIADIWEKIPEYTQMTYFSEFNYPQLKFFDMTYTWAFLLSEEKLKLERGSNFHQEVIKRSVSFGNKAAIEHFLRELSDEERNCCVFGTVNHLLSDRVSEWDLKSPLRFPPEKYSEVISYLFSMMRPGQEISILQNYPCIILRYFLYWPWHDLFLDIADKVWTFLDENTYDELLSLVIENVRSWGCYSSTFIQEFFIRSPSNFRKRFAFRRDSLFRDFFSAEDTEIIKVVIGNLGAEDRVRLVSDYDFLNLLDSLMMTDKEHLVQLCLREAALSKEEIQRLKGNLTKFVTGVDTRAVRLRKRKWVILFEFLNESDDSQKEKL